MNAEQEVEHDICSIVEDDSKVCALSEDSDDDFGDFEEVDDNTQDNHIQSTTSTEHPPSKRILKFDGDYMAKKEYFGALVDNIFAKSSMHIDKPSDVPFELNERADQIFERLTADDDSFLSLLIWKNSIIYEQVRLNLDIPQCTTNTVTPNHKNKSSENNSAELKSLYESLKSSPADSIFGKLLKQVPDFENLNIDIKGPEYAAKLNNTSVTLSEAHNLIKDTGSSDLEYLKKLTGIKKELLELMSIWNQRTKVVKEDNELFSSYVENLIGNTQKIRREKRICQSHKK